MCSVIVRHISTERDCLKLGVHTYRRLLQLGTLPAGGRTHQVSDNFMLMRSNLSVFHPFPEMAPVSIVGRVRRCQSCWKVLRVNHIHIVLPNFAVSSRAVSRGILISLSQLVLQQYVGTVCALTLQSFHLPLGKVGLIWPNPHTVS